VEFADEPHALVAIDVREMPVVVWIGLHNVLVVPKHAGAAAAVQSAIGDHPAARRRLFVLALVMIETVLERTWNGVRAVGDVLAMQSAQVPLAHVRRAVTRLLQELG
jgi:hypothetical protein